MFASPKTINLLLTSMTMAGTLACSGCTPLETQAPPAPRYHDPIRSGRISADAYLMAEGEGKIRSFTVSTGFIKTPLALNQIPAQAAQRGITQEEVVRDVMLGKSRVKGRAYVSKFNFKGQDQEQPVGSLSGGQRNRVQLAKMLRRGGNVVLLDEPTNDLDLMTLRVLEEAIQRFPGCCIVVSHDRFFLDRVCTHMLVFEGDGKIDYLEGNYADYEQWKEARGEKATAAAAKGGAHRRLTRD